MAKKKDADDVAAVYTSVMDHVVGGQGVLAAIRARWEAKLARRGAVPERDGAPPGYKLAAVGRPVGYCYNAPSSGPHHGAVVKEEEVAAVDDGAFFPAPAATPILPAAEEPETANDGATSRVVVTRDLLGTPGTKRKRHV